MPKFRVPEPPAYLTADLRKKFEEVAPVLSMRGLLSTGDVDILAKFLIAEAEYLRVTNKVTAAINSGDAASASTWITAQEKLSKQILALGAEFGLTPRSRRELGLGME